MVGSTFQNLHLMPKKRVSAGKQGGVEDEDMYNLPLIPQQAEKAPSAPLPASKKKKSQEFLPAPESESDEMEPVPSDVDAGSDANSSEDNESNEDAPPAQESGASSKGIVHDKR
jgi:hypothetical protein